MQITHVDDAECKRYAALMMSIRRKDYHARGGNKYYDHLGSKRAEYAVWHMLGSNPEERPDITEHKKRKHGPDVGKYCVKFCPIYTKEERGESWIYQRDPNPDPVGELTYFVTEVNNDPFECTIIGPVKREVVRAAFRDPKLEHLIGKKYAVYAEDLK